MFKNTFFETVQNLGFLRTEQKAKKLLRACAEVVFRQSLRATHHLRERAEATSPQKRRDNGDLAWRRDIDHQYHLHYWETSNGPEFASVVVHNDMTIPEQ